jgi:hypothetical protein
MGRLITGTMSDGTPYRESAFSTAETTFSTLRQYVQRVISFSTPGHLVALRSVV